MSDRSETIRALTDGPLDLLIVGGGIVGAGLARDAALRGLRTGLVEQHDFAFGTSSRSSRLLHGGLRYLAQGRLGLVHEASVEKRTVHRLAPHLAQPLPFVFPVWRGNPYWKLWQLKVGVKIYDLLCHGRNFGPSSWLARKEVVNLFPGLAEENLRGAVRYYDGFTNDARLVLDTLRSAARAGAHLLNYARFQSGTPCRGWQCVVEDRESADSLTIQARAVVNATGAWAERLPHSRVRLRLTKGIHLVVDQARLPVPETLVMTEGRRILFALPWGKRTIIGTTDTDYQGSQDRVVAVPEEIASLLKIANAHFPAARLIEADVISTWAGLRPLIADSRGNPSDISRSHQILNPEPGWWDVAGGKLTTYRLMAEQTLDRLVRALGGAAGRFGPCRTAAEPLLPAAEVGAWSTLIPPAFSREAVTHFCQKEWALHLSDVMIRRTGWHRYHPDAHARAAEVATWMRECLHWPACTREAELRHYQTAAELPE